LWYWKFLNNLREKSCQGEGSYALFKKIAYGKQSNKFLFAKGVSENIFGLVKEIFVCFFSSLS
jgi:hypothetical protein